MEFKDQLLAERLGIETDQGYWTVGGKFFFNKASCLKHASSIKDYNVRYSFLDSVYRSLNWEIEPQDSLDTLYRLRAEQIRSKHDYVILLYSGGADSTNILDTFMDNNIPIDEVVSCYPVSIIEKTINSFSAANTDKSNIMFEYVLAAQPKLKELNKRFPNTKITVVDYTDFSVDFVLSGRMDMIFQAGIAADPYHTSHFQIAQSMRNLAETKRICLMTGVDKPRLMYDIENKKFGCYFHDFNTIIGRFPSETLAGYKLDVEHFYYSSKFPLLLQKQCFILKHALIEKGMTDPVSAKKITTRVRDNRFIIYNSHTSFFRTTLYSKWNDNTWQADKDGTNYFFQSNSKWFHTPQFTDKRHRDYYAGQVNELVDGIDEVFIERDNGKVNKLKDYMSTPIWF